MQQSQHLNGIVLVSLSAVVFSMSGVLTKMIEADGWTIACWRGLIGGLAVIVYVEVRRGATPRGQAFRLGLRGWILASVGSVASITFIYSFKLTYVANVAVIYATAPFFAAGLAWLAMRETAKGRTLIAGILSLAGVTIIVSGGLGTGKLMGDLLAVVMTFGNAAYIVLIRKFADVPVVWAGGASALQLLLVGALMGAPLNVTAQDTVLLILFGLTFAAAVILWTEGTRLTPSAQSALLGAVEIPCATLLAWVVLSELPHAAAVLGGTVIMSAVLWHTVIDYRQQ
ncbi:DMT family transporter [Ruegeria meonggei]|uniref:EamA-like transporter family protein n=1 Tax=Ruegeria meonggei TaxID=1446476 RepID=A0A1X6Z426_9RHOB|nr:DMT family transporter [Ruegeria meonggei]SLN39914.1 EamA-like transporter family protein [Ruegeria meonggei]